MKRYIICFLVLIIFPINIYAKIIITPGYKEVFVFWTPPATRISGGVLSSDEIAGYNIYRSEKRGSEYAKINSNLLPEPNYLDSSVVNDKEYHYVLTTVDQFGFESAYSINVSAIPGLYPPAGVIATADVRKVILEWDTFVGFNLRGVSIFRAEYPGGPYQHIASVLENNSVYEDTDLFPGKNYYYVLRTVSVDWTESLYSQEVAATPMILSAEQLVLLEKITGFKATIQDGSISISWDENPIEDLAGYNIYRRSINMGEKFKKLNRRTLKNPYFLDSDVNKGSTYYYTICAVDILGNEAHFPQEVRVVYDDIFISSIYEDTEGQPIKAGKDIVVTLTGTSGLSASFDIVEVVRGIEMAETSQEGVYQGRYIVDEGKDCEQAEVIGYLLDKSGKIINLSSQSFITIDTTPPPILIENLEAEIITDGVKENVLLTWQSPMAQQIHYKMYRAQDKAEIRHNNNIIEHNISWDTQSLMDNSVLPGRTYYYGISAVDIAGNESLGTDLAEVAIPEDIIPPVIRTVEDISRPGSKRVGDRIRVKITGEPQCTASFSLGMIKDQLMIETSTGVYFGEYTVQIGDEVIDKPIIGTLQDISENISTARSKTLINASGSPDSIPPKIHSVHHNGYFIANGEPLVCGDRLHISVTGDSGCTAYVDLGGFLNNDNQIEVHLPNLTGPVDTDIRECFLYKSDKPIINIQQDTLVKEMLDYPKEKYLIEHDLSKPYLAMATSRRNGASHIIVSPRLGIELKEVSPGIYEGDYSVQPGDYLMEGFVYARLVNTAGITSEIVSTYDALHIDTSAKIAIFPEKPSLPADKKATTRICVSVSDIRGNPFAGHPIELTLFSTSEYTGIMGVGSLDEYEMGYLDGKRWHNETDFNGRVFAEYISGFAAKTVIIRAEDKFTGDTAVSYITSFIEASVDIELKEVKHARFHNSGYKLFVISEHDWLTADGVSTSKITAYVTENDQPVKGHRISFSITDGEGRLSTINNITDEKGKAVAIYTAGYHICRVEITVVDITANISDRVYIILKSDAPAKINMTHGPTTLPADGASKSHITVELMDINDNPNRGERVEFIIEKGGGRLSSTSEITDFFGVAGIDFIAGSIPGRTTIKALYTSKIPTKEELEQARYCK
ncbi:MAG: Ig-like domain-containing protein [bacterium]